jgi:hypothetical protein
MKKRFTLLLFYLFIIVFCNPCFAQQSKDTTRFFLAKKKGLLGKLGRSISRDGEIVEPIKIVDKYKAYKGKTIRKIVMVPVGFNHNMNDTAEIRNTFSVHVAKALHKGSTNNLIRKNLFFKEGDKVLPLLFSDNERFLRDQPFLQDALIVVFNSVESTDSVDVVVLTRDVFSLGGSINISSVNRAELKVKEENLNGSGNKLLVGMLYDKKRSPGFGWGGELIKRNLGGSFFNWTTGFSTYNGEIFTGRKEESHYYTSFEKPLVSRYTEWTAALSVSYNSTTDAYMDSLYYSDHSYTYMSSDIWGGYNIGARNRKEKDDGKRLRHFVSMRSFYNHFYKVPEKYINDYNYNYADINGLLFSYSLYRQNFYQTNFIYGFGRNEDVPEGINATVTSGYTNKQGKRRAYYGLDFDASHYSKKGFFTNYTMRSGGFVNQKKIEDLDLLVNIDHFTSLRKMGSYWRNRNFVSASFTRQINPNLNVPLFLESDFGLPYFRNGLIKADCRSTFRFESVFYNLRKTAGFRVAPFIFSDVSFLKPIGKGFDKTNGYSAIGGGLRTRNENLIFGTVELRGYYFPRISYDGMKNWKVELSTNLKFKYNSTFIRKPDFVIAN